LASPFTNLFKNLGKGLGVNTDALMSDLTRALQGTFSHRAMGGRVSAGEPVFVGDNPDGSLNGTSELFIPDRSGTVLSAGQTQRSLGGRGGFSQTNYFTINNNVDAMDVLSEVSWRTRNA
jgi:hypothetical protein